MSVFSDFSSRTGMFRCRVTGNPCGTDTTLVGVECPMGKNHPCPHRVAFEAGYEAAYAGNCAPRVSLIVSCGVCQNTGKLKGETCPYCGGQCDYTEGHSTVTGNQP